MKALYQINKKMERSDEDIVECIKSCWPEFTFNVADIRRPIGDKFRDILFLFLKTFNSGNSGNYQLPGCNLPESTKTPEMFQHLEGNISLYRESNFILKSLNYHNLSYGDLIWPTTAKVREVLAVLINFLAYYESADYILAETESEVLALKQKKIQSEKQLNEKRKHLEKLKQQEEEKKIQDSELRRLISAEKDQLRKSENTNSKLDSEIGEATKREESSRVKLEQLLATVKQLEGEREKAAEAVVPDPEELEQELAQCNSELHLQNEALSVLKERLPPLEQQLQERIAKLQVLNDISQRITELKISESRIRAEYQAEDSELKRMEKEEEALKDRLNKETSVVESKKRMLDQGIQRTNNLRAETEKTRTELTQALNDDASRKNQQQQLAQNMEKEISGLLKELESGQKALDEGVAMSRAMDSKFQNDMKSLEDKATATYDRIQQHLDRFITSSC